MSGERGRRLARRMLSGWRRAHGRVKAAPRRSPLEELLIGILADDGSERRAAGALDRLREQFVDWNEVRVGTAAEIAFVVPGIPDALRKGECIRRVLDRVAEHSSDLSLDFLKELSPQDAAALVEGIPGFPEHALSRVTVLLFGHDSFPPTSQVVTLCRRIGLLHDGDKSAHVGVFRKLLPRSGMYEFHALAYRHATTICRDHQPACVECTLRLDCREARTAEAAAAAEAKRRKPSPPPTERVAQKTASPKQASTASRKPRKQPAAGRSKVTVRKKK